MTSLPTHTDQPAVDDAEPMLTRSLQLNYLEAWRTIVKGALAMDEPDVVARFTRLVEMDPARAARALIYATSVLLGDPARPLETEPATEPVMVMRPGSDEPQPVSQLQTLHAQGMRSIRRRGDSLPSPADPT